MSTFSFGHDWGFESDFCFAFFVSISHSASVATGPCASQPFEPWWLEQSHGQTNREPPPWRELSHFAGAWNGLQSESRIVSCIDCLYCVSMNWPMERLDGLLVGKTVKSCASFGHVAVLDGFNDAETSDAGPRPVMVLSSSSCCMCVALIMTCKFQPSGMAATHVGRARKCSRISVL